MLLPMEYMEMDGQVFGAKPGLKGCVIIKPERERESIESPNPNPNPNYETLHSMY